MSYHALGDSVWLQCQVLANPFDPTEHQFTWKLNGSTFMGNLDEDVELDGLRNGTEQQRRSKAIMHQFSTEGDKWSGHSQANDNNNFRARTHSPSQQSHLITNSIQIKLSDWNRFGHYSCQTSNAVGEQQYPCQWQLMANPMGRATAKLASSRQNHNEQEGVLRSDNCQVQESSNLVVIKCDDKHSSRVKGKQ